MKLFSSNDAPPTSPPFIVSLANNSFAFFGVMLPP